MLHLHGLEHSECLSARDALALFYEYARNLAGHRRHDALCRLTFGLGARERIVLVDLEGFTVANDCNSAVLEAKDGGGGRNCAVRAHDLSPPIEDELDRLLCRAAQSKSIARAPRIAIAGVSATPAFLGR